MEKEITQLSALEEKLLHPIVVEFNNEIAPIFLKVNFIYKKILTENTILIKNNTESYRDLLNACLNHIDGFIAKYKRQYDSEDTESVINKNIEDATMIKIAVKVLLLTLENLSFNFEKNTELLYIIDLIGKKIIDFD